MIRVAVAGPDPALLRSLVTGRAAHGTAGREAHTPPAAVTVIALTGP